jgi:hypothetical protein
MKSPSSLVLSLLLGLSQADYFGLPPLDQCTPQSMLPPDTQLPWPTFINRPSEWQGFEVVRNGRPEMADLYQGVYELRHLVPQKMLQTLRINSLRVIPSENRVISLEED